MQYKSYLLQISAEITTFSATTCTSTTCTTLLFSQCAYNWESKTQTNDHANNNNYNTKKPTETIKTVMNLADHATSTKNRQTIGTNDHQNEYLNRTTN